LRLGLQQAAQHVCCVSDLGNTASLISTGQVLLLRRCNKQQHNQSAIISAAFDSMGHAKKSSCIGPNGLSCHLVWVQQQLAMLANNKQRLSSATCTALHHVTHVSCKCRFAEAEKTNGRWAMMAVVGILGTELLGVQPAWWEAGAKDYGVPMAPLTAMEFLVRRCRWLATAATASAAKAAGPIGHMKVVLEGLQYSSCRQEWEQAGTVGAYV
jgi:hypothetical protein